MGICHIRDSKGEIYKILLIKLKITILHRSHPKDIFMINKCFSQKKLEKWHLFPFLQISLISDLKELDSHMCFCIRFVAICYFG